LTKDFTDDILYINDKGEDTMKLSIHQLQMYAKKFLKDNYNLDLVVPLQLNGRLNTCKGRFVSYRGTKIPKVIELNKIFVEHNDPAVVLDVLRHELVHYALFMLNKPNSDGHPVFENELKRLGVISQFAIDKYDIVTKCQVYGCSNCKKEYTMARRLSGNGKNHRCKCGGSLIDKGKKLVTL
jgi:SprT-like protein